MTKDEALKLALEALTNAYWPTDSDLLPAHNIKECAEAITAIKAALANEALERKAENARELGLDYEPLEAKDEPVAWMHTKIDGVVVPHRPADLNRHPDRWTALYKDPKPCPTCEALARTVMLDQTSHDATPPQRKPLTEQEIGAILEDINAFGTRLYTFARAIEAAHGIKG